MSDITTAANEVIDELGPDAQADQPTIESQIEEVVDEYSIPISEAKRMVHNNYEDEQSGESDNAQAHPEQNHQVEVTPIENVNEDGEWVNLEAEVDQLWDPNHESMHQVGLLADDTGKTKFTAWKNDDGETPATLPNGQEFLQEGETYLFETVITSEYQGKYSVELKSVSSVSESDAEIDTDAQNSSDSTTFSGVFAEVRSGSGLIKRCTAEEDCTRVLNNGRCSVHGDVEGEFDLRIKGVIDDGTVAQDVIFDAEQTEKLVNIDIEEAREMAMDALDTSVVTEEIVDEVRGDFFEVSGPELGTNLLVENFEREREPTEEATAELNEKLNVYRDDDDTLSVTEEEARCSAAREVENRHEAVHLFAPELNNTKVEFQIPEQNNNSDGQRDPNYYMLPTGQGVNRVAMCGVLTEVKQVSDEGEPEQVRAKLFDSTGNEFWVYGGQYSPEPRSDIIDLAPEDYDQGNPELNSDELKHVMVIGKPSTFQKDNGEVLVSVSPESFDVVDQETREQFDNRTSSAALTRLAAFEQDKAPFGEEAEMEYDYDYQELANAVEYAITGVDTDNDVKANPDTESQSPEPASAT